MAERSDQEWVRALKQRDEQVLTELWQLLYTYCSICVRRYVNAPQEGQDIVAEAALQTYTRLIAKGKIDSYRFEGPFPAFCRVIVVNEMRRLLSKSRLEEIELVDELTAAEAEADWTDLANVVSDQIILERLQPCLELLSSFEQEVFLLRRRQNLMPERVAAKLGRTRNYINVTDYRIRVKLKTCLQGRGYGSVEDVLAE